MRAPIDVYRPKPLPFPKPPIGCIPPQAPLPTQPSGLMDDVAFRVKDVNRDDKLSLTEYAGRPGFRTMPNPEKVKEFKRYDKDGDGALTRDEYKAGKALDRLVDRFRDRDWNPFPKPKPQPSEGGIELKPLPWRGEKAVIKALGTD
ncbi:MAG: hypothetical protein ACK46X_10775 [Candidatus Sericytochromatia bacterium]